MTWNALSGIPIIFDSLNANLIEKAALKTKGAAGLSRFRLAKTLLHLIQISLKGPLLAAVGRRLCTSLENPDGLTACRLIPLDKCPGQ